MTIRTFSTLLLVPALISGLSGHCFGADIGVSKGPYVQAPAPGAVTIMWESTTNYPGVIHVWSGTSEYRKLSPVLPHSLTGVSSVAQGTNRVKTTNIIYLYSARFRGLQPDRTYSYTVEINGRRTDPCRFTTLDEKADKVTFIAYGDSRSVPKIHSLLAEQFKRHKPDFILHTGDLVAKGTDYGLWSTEFFTPLRSVTQRTPVFPVIGNHEQDGTNYLSFFDLPGKELWYSFDVGPVHVLALDFRSQASNEPQYQFARRDLLNARAPWKVVMLHYPVFNIGGHATGWGHTNYVPLFNEAEVDLVLSGHSHLYERFRPVAPRNRFGISATAYVTTGGGGASLHASFDHPALASRHTTNHFVVFEATGDKLTAKAIRPDGRLIDAFQLRKHKGRYSSSYLAQSYPQESLQLVSPITACISSHVAGVPSLSNAVDLRATVRSPRCEPAALDLSLAPESAQYYVLERPLLGLETAQPGMTNFVWTKVRSTGATNIVKTKDNELSPPLILKVKVASGSNETIAYASRTRVSASLPAPPPEAGVPLSAKN